MYNMVHASGVTGMEKKPKNHINLKIACLSENVFVETDLERVFFATFHKNTLL